MPRPSVALNKYIVQVTPANTEHLERGRLKTLWKALVLGQRGHTWVRVSLFMFAIEKMHAFL